MTIVSATDEGALSHPRQAVINRAAWVQILILAALFIPLHKDFLHQLYGFHLGTNSNNFLGFEGFGFALTDLNWSHALLVPLFSIYFIYEHRQYLRRTAARACWWGLPIMLMGLAGYCLSIYPVRNDMLKGYSMIVELLGLTLLLVGPRVMSVLWFPIVYLAFCVKVSYSIWESIAVKLQWIAAQGAVLMVTLVGGVIELEAEVSGTTIELIKDGLLLHPALNVAEACSGLRALMMFIALGVAVAYLTNRPWWARIVMLLSTLPVAVAVNVCRVTTLAFIYPYHPEWTKGDMHTLIGLVIMLAVALGLFALEGWVLDRLIIKETTGTVDSTMGKAGAAPAAKGAE